MKLKLSLLTAVVLSSTLLAGESAEILKLKEEIQELREVTQLLIDETSDLKTGFNYTVVDSTKSFSGLGAAASKVYYSKSPLSIGGYGEMYFAKQNGDSTNKSTVDVYRFVPYIGYKFTDNIIMNTELEFEHGGSKQSTKANLSGGYAIVEFMYLDFLINDYANIRVGNFLMPMGLINERHEPTLFTTVQRPNSSKYLLPSTWTENGAMVFGNITDSLSYKVAAVTALQTEDNGEKWLRNGRGGSLKQVDPNLAFVARADYTGYNGLLVGVSAYHAPSVGDVSSNTTIVDVHADYKVSGARVYGTYSSISRSNADAIATDAVESGAGGFINISYDLLSLTSSSKSLPLFVQHEKLNPEKSRADGTSGDTTTTTTLGVNYFPHEQVVLKSDIAMQEKGTTEDTILSFSMGYIF